jgi:alpha-L-fucosidase
MANNLVHDAPHHALGSGGNDNVIEFNEVHDVIQETGDAGALHIGRDWTMRGNKIQFNFWHHIRGPKLEGSAFTSAISVYLDDMWSGTFVYGNIFHDCDWAVLIGGGHDNIIENNLMSKCGLGFSGDRRSLGWGRLSFAKGGSARMFERLAAVPYKLEPWRTKYPNLVNILENEPLISKGNLITRNVFSGETWMLMIDGADFSNYQVTQNVIAAENLARWQFEIGGERKTIPFGEENLTKQLEGLGNIMVRTNPGFVETEAGELRLSDNSPAFSLGFKPIPYENIGLFVDQWRTALPSRPRRQPEGEPELLEEGSPHMKYLFDLALPAGLFALLMACAAPTSREPDAYSVDERQMKEAMELFQAEPPVTILANTHPDAQWFPKAGLGLFMHWGIHSVAGIQPSWAMIKNYPAGGDSNFHPPEKYYALASKFDPQNYDPGKWMAAARAAGFTYAVLTTKHHDGYALWPTKYGDMNTRRYLGGRDLIKPYVEACRKHGLKVGFYFSPRDWHYPNYPLDDVDFDYSKRLKFRPIRDPIQNELNFEKFYAYTIGQLRELLTQYGKIDVLWFDGISWHPFKDIRTRQTLAWVRRLQPGIVINPRWGDMGDFETPEIELPQGRPQGWWESCYIWPKGHWGYVPSEDFQPLSWVLETLVRCRMWGGNLLLNVGPRPDGTMPDAFYQYSRELAQWMAHSGESLIGAGSSPDDSRSNVPITRRKGVWYLHLLYKHRGPAELKEVPAPRTIKLLRTGQSIPFRGTRTLVLEVPETARTSLDDVVGVYWDQEPETQ